MTLHTFTGVTVHTHSATLNGNRPEVGGQRVFLSECVCLGGGCGTGGNVL